MAKGTSRGDSRTNSTKAKPAKRVVAAGAVLWRPDAETGLPRIAVIHRPRYDDWSLPKGKLDQGESEQVAAVREIWEETGQRCHLGRRLTDVSYPIPEGIKVVHYWAALAVGGEFIPGDEVDRLDWLSPPDAAQRLTYPYDRDVLGMFGEHLDTQTVLIVRHGTAGVKSRYRGDDRGRPLDKNGRAQAESLVGLLTAFGPTVIHAADRARCTQTVEPLAQELGLTVAVEADLTEEAYADNPEATRKRVLEIVAAGGTPVICTQGKVIPYLLAWWRDGDDGKPDKARNRKGSTWVLSLADGHIVAAEYIASPLPHKGHKG